MAFQRYSVTDDNFIRGAGRMLLAAITQAFPTSIADIVNLSSYDPATGWTDAGGTKTGITISNNVSEQTFDIDQELLDIDSRPTGYEYSVATAFAQADLEHMQIAWEGGAITTVGSERQMGVGTPAVFQKRMVAVLFQKANNKLRAFVFRKVQRTPQASDLVFAKDGDQQTIPVQFKALADASIADVLTRVYMVFDQI